MKVRNKKGFTLAELLIVMAIVVVLASVAVPTFGRQMETSRETSDMEVVRNCYEEALTVAMRDSLDGVLDGKDGKNASDQDIFVSTYYPGIEFSDANSKASYVVTLNNLSSRPKISQGTSGWQYVKGVLFGVAVPDITYASTTLTFEFEIPAPETANGTEGSLTLKSIT